MRASRGVFVRVSVVLAVAVAGVVWSATLPAVAGTTSVSINFDDHSAPCNFDQTVALTTQYSGQGVKFSGPGAYNGGGVLNECGNFGVSGYSPPNFLAFNNGAHFSNGGIPKGPELILFTTATYDHVQINVACVAGGQARLQAFDSNKQLIATSIINLSSALATVSVDDPNGRASIKAVKLMTNQGVWVADDLSAS